MYIDSYLYVYRYVDIIKYIDIFFEPHQYSAIENIKKIKKKKFNREVSVTWTIAWSCVMSIVDNTAVIGQTKFVCCLSDWCFQHIIDLIVYYIYLNILCTICMWDVGPSIE